MVRLLVANGCSFTRGQELADPRNEVWPAVLAKTLGVPCVNLASDGASNRRIVRTTVSRLATVCADASVRPDEVLVLLMWTDTSRHEFYVPARRPLFFAGRRAGAGGDWVDINAWRLNAGHRPSRAFYDHLWSEEGQVTNLFHDWLLLDRFLAHDGYVARYTFATPQPHVPEAARWFVQQLPTETTLGGVPPGRGMTFTEMAGKRPCGPGGHPLADSHALLARRLAEWLASDGIAADRSTPR